MDRAIFNSNPPPPSAKFSYGPAPSQFGDLRLPPGLGPHPVALVIHGGYWRARYDLTYIGHVCAALTGAGLATWNIEYRRLGEPGGGWPGTWQDVAAAADYLINLGQRYPLDLARTVAVGHSAGGHLALWLAARVRLPRRSLLYSPEALPLKGVVALAGVADLRLGVRLGLSQGVVAEFVGGSPDEVPERYAAASPAELLPLGVRQILIHGTADEDVPLQVSQSYFQAAQTKGDPVELISLEGVDHFAPVDPASAQWSQVLQAILALI